MIKVILDRRLDLFARQDRQIAFDLRHPPALFEVAGDLLNGDASVQSRQAAAASSTGAPVATAHSSKLALSLNMLFMPFLPLQLDDERPKL
jgi:hypothetical protein